MKLSASGKLAVPAFVYLFSAVLVTQGCGSGGTHAQAPLSGGPADLPGAATVHIEADVGGTLVAGNGTRLEIPAHALREDTTVTLTPVGVLHLGDTFVAGARYEPEGLVLALPVTSRIVLPESWDGDERPDVCPFTGADPRRAVCGGDYVTITGSDGAFLAEVKVDHFSGHAVRGKPARNCHEGTLQHLLANFAARKCLRPESLDKVIRKYKTERNMDIVFPEGKPWADWETPIQAFLDTYFTPEPVFGPLDQTWLNQFVKNYLDPTAAPSQRHEVVLAFGGVGGQWQTRPDGLLEAVNHTAVLTYKNGKLKLRNSVSAREEIVNALVEKYGENVYWFPPGDQELTAAKLQEFMGFRTGAALELDLCGKLGCLGDKSQNLLDDGRGIAPLGPYNQRRLPYTALKVFVANLRNDIDPCTGTQLGGKGLLRTTVNIAYFAGDQPRQYEAGFEAKAVYSYVDPQGIQVMGTDSTGDEMTVALMGNLTPGTYQSASGLAHLVFNTSEIRNQNDGQIVDVIAESGGLVLDTFEPYYGGTIKGHFFDVRVAGCQINEAGTACWIVTGTLTPVEFDIVLADSQLPTARR